MKPRGQEVLILATHPKYGRRVAGPLSLGPSTASTCTTLTPSVCPQQPARTQSVLPTGDPSAEVQSESFPDVLPGWPHFLPRSRQGQQALTPEPLHMPSQQKAWVAQPHCLHDPPPRPPHSPACLRVALLPLIPLESRRSRRSAGRQQGASVSCPICRPGSAVRGGQESAVSETQRKASRASQRAVKPHVSFPAAAGMRYTD